MENCGLTKADGATLHEILGRSNGINNGQLQSLTLGRNHQMGVDGAAYIGGLLAELLQLEEFSYKQGTTRPLLALKVGVGSSRALAQGLADGHSSRLRLLDLAGCHFGSSAAAGEEEEEYATASGRSASACAGRRPAWST